MRDLIPSWPTPQCLFYQIITHLSSKITITNFGHAISLGNALLRHKDKHPLMLEMYFSPSLYTLEWSEELLSAYLINLWPKQCHEYQMITHISCKITNFGHQNSLGNVSLYRGDRQPLLLEWFKSFIKGIRMIGRASDSRYDPLVVNTVSFLQNKCSHFK